MKIMNKFLFATIFLFITPVHAQEPELQEQVNEAQNTLQQLQEKNTQLQETLVGREAEIENKRQVLEALEAKIDKISALEQGQEG